MRENKILDYGSTTVGGGLGLDQLYGAIQDLATNGTTGQEWVALVKGILLIVFGFFSWRNTF